MHRYTELAALIARHSTEDGIQPTAIETLFFGSRSSPSEPLHVAQNPCFALVAQGGKSLTLGEHTLHYGVGDFLLVALDVPVVSHVTVASPELAGQ